MILFETKIICLQTKSFLDVKPQIIILLLNHVYFVGSEFSRSNCRLRMPSNSFWTFIFGVSELV